MRELRVRADLAFFLRHADVRLVDAKAFGVSRGGVFPDVWDRRHPELAKKAAPVRLLDDAANVGGDAIHPAVLLGDDVYLHAAAVAYLSEPFIVGKEQAPDAVLVADERIAKSVPVVEGADQSQLQGFRCPLAIPHARLAK